MKIETNQPEFLPVDKKSSAATNLEKEKTATEFEQILAQQLVNEMTKGMFESDDNSVMGQSMNFYRYHITQTLASELAQKHELGIADMLLKNWNNLSTKK